MQFLEGRAGDDIYYYGMESGRVRLNYNAEHEGWGNDRFVFKDLSLSDLTFSTFSEPNGETIRMSWSKEGEYGSAEIYDMGRHIERFEFADGTSLSEIGIRPDGSSELIGTSGNDRISGTSGVDHLTGGSGSDTFVFSENSGNDHVTDFTNGEDLIHIESGASAFADLILAASGSDALVQFGGTTITLDGVQLADLDQGDFLFS
ncbi:Poly(beta-D-mannuronate) C5 epimerase 2 [Roseibium album]|nr:Poly(beta-D-mannuronate) C5 epimerase 2 [Roseibium album]